MIQRKFSRSLLIVIAILALGVNVIQAQPEVSRPSPSHTGGSIGSPGMSGAALNAGTPQFSGGSGRQGSGRQRQGNNGRDWQGGGFMAPGAEGFTARFGERGSGNISLENMLSNFEVFVKPGEGSPTFSWRDLTENPWHPGELPEGIPTAPAVLEQIQAAIQSTGEQAQDAYDSLWQDYYAAVDATAQVYYDTVAASADYMLQTYEDAVNYTTDAIDYYVDYAEQYAAYCVAYPWDCYSYLYDAVSDTYVYVGSTSDQPVSTIQVGDVTTTINFPIEAVPEPSAEAYEAIVVFANDQLGAVVEPLYAGVATGDIQTVMTYLPPEIQAYLLNATGISATAYWGILNGGAAGVAVGDCNPGCDVTTENLSFQLSSASAGAYGLFVNAAVPVDAGSALLLLTQVYPKLEGLAFAQIADVEQGFAFTATAAGLGLDSNTGQPLSVAKVVYAGTVEVDGKPFVYALVGVGEKYADLLAN